EHAVDGRLPSVKCCDRESPRCGCLATLRSSEVASATGRGRRFKPHEPEEGRALTKIVLPLMRAIILIPLFHAPAQALTSATPQTRTYVSGTGSDSYPCTATQPCKTLQAALSLTVAGGEIFVLNSANYGPVTITKAVTITGEGAVAGMLSTSGAG